MVCAPACRVARCLAPALVLTWALSPAPRAASAAASASLRLAASSGLDTNARRDFLQVGTVPDLVESGFAAARGELSTDDASLRARYDVGARKFIFHPTEDTLVNLARLEGTKRLARFLRLGVLGQWGNRRGGTDLAYTDLLGGAFLELVPDARVEVRLEGRGHRYLYWPAYEYSFAAPELSTTTRYHFDRHHSVFAFGELGQRRYDAQARPSPDAGPQPGPAAQRADVVLTAGAGYSYRGPFSLSVDYAFLSQGSNSFGESLQRHRVTLVGALRLPWSLSLLGELALQFTRYPDGVYLSAQFSLKQDDESFNQVSLRLVRPLSERLDLEINYALFYDRLPANDLTYLRQVAGVGLALRL